MDTTESIAIFMFFILQVLFNITIMMKTDRLEEKINTK